MAEAQTDRSDAEWLRDFDARNKDVTEGDVLLYAEMTWRELAESLRAEVERLRREIDGPNGWRAEVAQARAEIAELRRG